jgi:nucleoid-associated protein Lsr2
MAGRHTGWLAGRRRRRPISFAQRQNWITWRDIVAQKTVVELVDDLDGGEADETVFFALDGVDFRIDLSAENAARLRDTLAEYVGHARKVGGRKQTGRTGARTDRADAQVIRDWARRQGEAVAERGRISQELRTRFQQAHSA